MAAWAWLFLPAVLCAAGTIVLATPVRLFGMRLPEPVFPMVLAFAWAMIRPSVLGPLVLLGLGLFLDLYWGAPLGLWAVSLLIAYGGALLARNLMAGASPPALCGWYVGWTVVAFGGAYLFIMLQAHVTPDFLSVFFQFLVTAALFPLSYRLIDLFEDADIRFR